MITMNFSNSLKARISIFLPPSLALTTTKVSFFAAMPSPAVTSSLSSGSLDAGQVTRMVLNRGSLTSKKKDPDIDSGMETKDRSWHIG